MRVLYLDHPAPDIMSGVLYKGLMEELGPESVIDHPWKALYHGHKYECDGSVNAPFPWMASLTATRGSMSLDVDVAEFDLVILMSPRPGSVDALQRIIDRVGRAAIKRLAFVDGEDYTTVRWDIVDRFCPDVVFKLSTVPEPFEVYPTLKAKLEASTRVVPFPLATPVEPLDAGEKDIDVAFLGGNNWRPARLRREGVAWTGHRESEYKAALDARLSREFSSFVGSVKEKPISHTDFMALLNRSKVAVCVGGYGIEPMRTYEILACSETMLMRERIPVIAPHPLVEGTHCAMFDTGDGFDYDELVRKIHAYLDAPAERRRIAVSGNSLLREHYTPRARARQLLSEMGCAC